MQTLARTLGFMTVHWTVTLAGSNPREVAKQKSLPSWEARIVVVRREGFEPPIS